MGQAHKGRGGACVDRDHGLTPNHIGLRNAPATLADISVLVAALTV